MRKTNFAFVQVARYGPTAPESDFQRENLPPAAAREQIIQHVLRQLYPPAYVQEHLAGRSAELFGRKVSQVEEEYRNTPGFPMLLAQSVFHEAIRNLVMLGNVIGLEHSAEDQGRVCGRQIRLSGDQLAEAIICASVSRLDPAFTRAAAWPPASGAGSGTTATRPGSWPQSRPGTDAGRGHCLHELPWNAAAGPAEVARLLETRTDPRVEKVRIALAYDERETEMSTLPAFFRGTLSGIGRFAGEASLEFTGVFTKAETEELLERLPDFAPGACRVTLSITSQ